jgi:hypothetical protein
MAERNQFNLSADDIPSAWFNIMPDIAGSGAQPLPPLHPGTQEPVTPDLLAPLFPEALIMQGQNGDAPLNQVRERAGLGSKTNATLDDLKHERRVELAAEYADRHLDLIRWGYAEVAYSKPSSERNHSYKTDPNSPYEVYEVWPGRTFNPEIHHVWPIPPNVLATSGINQNQGW